MLNESNTNIERIIAKIDNDFNPDNSDWIPRVAAWCIDAMSQIDVLPTEKYRTILKVNNKIAYSCEKLPNDVKVYDENGCRLEDTNKTNCQCNGFSTGSQKENSCELTPDTVSIDNTGNYGYGESMATPIAGTFPVKHNVSVLKYPAKNKNFVLIDNHQIELNYNAKYITVEYNRIQTECSEQYGCELPIIPNNGTLIEAIVYYCMYKMLCRGYKHPVFNLAASQYGTNPYFMWTQLKDKAKRSIINNGINEDLSKLWRSAMFINMFDPRR